MEADEASSQSASLYLSRGEQVRDKRDDRADGWGGFTTTTDVQFGPAVCSFIDWGH